MAAARAVHSLTLPLIEMRASMYGTQKLDSEVLIASRRDRSKGQLLTSSAASLWQPSLAEGGEVAFELRRILEGGPSPDLFQSDGGRAAGRSTTSHHKQQPSMA